MKYSDEFIEETLKENINLRLEFFNLKEKAQKYYEKYNNYRHQISKEAQNKNKVQIVRERDILQDKINKAIEYIEKHCDIGYLEQDKCTDVLYQNECQELLDILRGEDNEN